MLYIFTCSSLHILTCSHTHIFTNSHLHIFLPSHTLTSSHLLIFTSSRPHICTLHTSSLSLSLSLSLFTFTYQFLTLEPHFVRKGCRGGCKIAATLSYKMRFECQKLIVFCDFGWSGGNASALCVAAFVCKSACVYRTVCE